MTNDKLITEARSLCAKATPGPWVTEDNCSIAAGPNVKHVALVSADDGDKHRWYWECDPGNANFIARSRTIIPELADALEVEIAKTTSLSKRVLIDGEKLDRLRARIAELEGAAKEAYGWLMTLYPEYRRGSRWEDVVSKLRAVTGENDNDEDTQKTIIRRINRR